jgi:hypothetical protein
MFVEQAISRHPGIEEKRHLPVCLRDRDQTREPVLGSERAASFAEGAGHVHAPHRVATGHQEVQRQIENREDLDAIHLREHQARRRAHCEPSPSAHSINRGTFTIVVAGGRASWRR